MGCACSTTATNAAMPEDKQLVVEFLFLDEETCVPCGSTSDALQNAVSILANPMKEMGISLDIQRVHVTTLELAIEKQFRASPTIRVMGRDIDPAITEDDCPSCGNLAGDDIKIDCRTWHWRGKVYQAAPVGKIVEEIMAETVKLASGSDDCCEDTCCADADAAPGFVLPENLQGFFAARRENTPLGC